MGQRAMARATHSSLKAHRSSREPPPPAGDDQIDVLPAPRQVQGGGDLLRRPLPLHPHGDDQHPGHGPAGAQNADHIPHRGPRRGGDQGDAPGKGGQGALARRVKQPLPLQLFPQLLKGQVQRPPAVGEQLGAVELHLPVPGKDGQPAKGQHPHAVGGLEAQPGRVPPEEDAPQAPPVILQGEVVVARGIFFVIGDFPPHQQGTEQGVGLQKVFQIAVDLGDGVDGQLAEVHARAPRSSARWARMATPRALSTEY